MSALAVSSSDLFDSSSQLIQSSYSSQMDSEATLSSDSFTFFEKQPTSSFKKPQKQESETEIEHFQVSGGEVVVSNDHGDICPIVDVFAMSKFLDQADVQSTKRILGKLLNEIEDNSRHHQIKINEFSNLPLEEKIEDALLGIQIAMDEASIEIAGKFNNKLAKMDRQMNVLDEIAEIGRELNIMETFLDSNISFIQRDLDTIHRINENLLKEKDLAFNLSELEEQSIHHRNSWKSLEYDAPKYQQIVEKEKNFYGLAENVLVMPMALVQLTDFEKILAKAQRFYEDCVGVPKIDFDKVFDLLEKTKDTLEAGCQSFTAEQVACLSPMASSFSNYSSFLSSVESLNTKSFLSSSNILEKAISRKSSYSSSSETSIDMPLANSVNSCTNSVTVSTPGYYSKSESNESIRTAGSCPNDMECFFKTALEQSPLVDKLLTAINPSPNTPSSTILI